MSHLYTRQVRLYFTHSSRVQPLFEESFEEIEDIIRNWILNEERNYEPVSAIVQYPDEEAVKTSWIEECRWSGSELMDLVRDT